MKSLKPPCESSLPITISNLAMSQEGQIIVQTTVEGRASLKVGHTGGRVRWGTMQSTLGCIAINVLLAVGLSLQEGSLQSGSGGTSYAVISSIGLLWGPQMSPQEFPDTQAGKAGPLAEATAVALEGAC